MLFLTPSSYRETLASFPTPPTSLLPTVLKLVAAMEIEEDGIYVGHKMEQANKKSLW